MRAVAEIQSLNWRMILVVTLCCMGVYFLLTGDGFGSRPSTSQLPGAQLESPSPVTPVQRPPEVAVSKAGTGTLKESVVPVKDNGKIVNVESKFKTQNEEVAQVERPYPTLGDEYDAPFDAFPGRQRPAGDEDEGEDDEVLEANPEPEAESEQVQEKEGNPTIEVPGKPETPANPAPDSNSGSNEDQKQPPTPPSIKPPSEQLKAAKLHPPNLVPEPGSQAAKELQFEEDYNYIAICAALKDVPIDLPEWLIHHYNHLQIRNFYIMDDGSDPPLSTIPTVDLGIPPASVHFQFQDQSTRGTNEQLLIYQRCLQNWGKRHKWMIFLDGDEFLEMTAGNETLLEFLKEKEQEPGVGAVAVNWRMHTSSGLLKRPTSARKAFTECIWDGKGTHNLNVKSILRTDAGLEPTSPHTWHLKEGFVTVGEHGDQLEGFFRQGITRDRIALHHYAGKSREEYEEKMGRGNAMNDPKKENFWQSIEYELPHVGCPEMAEYDP
ncbi:hypothetical protein HYFRA_00012033 [Hymenoscyphus fraxineus]|uniref:Glycosyltransferase family 92 protein n=1 Tax=Hymenoscyphus fraxineus TaxID=746836 RepID=A0A9N9KZZ5_9HELO|nr:hypothetical protein HYFRA_00012033 [Hymenoscyphus fraxineus]